jgi:tetratricopeptide (TPR) repeat protein
VLRRRLGITALAVLVASAGAATHSGLSNLEPICQEGEARLAESWSPDEQAVAAEQLASLGGYGRDLAARLRAEVAAFAGRWSAEHRALCLARRQRSQSDVLLDRRAACLDRGRWALGSLADVVRGATASTAPAVAVALSALPDAAACGDLTALANDVEPPATRLRHLVDVLQRQVEEARMQIAAGRYLEARDGAGRTLTEARRLAYAPLLAEVLLVVGHASMMLPAGRAAAVAVLEEAVAVALAARAYPVAVEAWARGRWTRATSDGDPAALDGLAVMEGLARGLPSAPFVRALLHNNVGSAWLALQRQEPARQAFERALREADGYRGPGAVELVNIRGNLALITTDAARRDQLFAAAEAELGRLLGNDHPQTLEMRWSRGRRTASAATAEALLEPACRGFERHADAGDRAAECWLEVAFLRSERGAPDGARDAVHRAEAAASRESPQWLDACAQRLVMDGRAREAAHSFTALLAGGPAPEARRWWEAARTAEHELGHGRALLALGDLAGARRALMASARQLEAIVERHPGWSALERRLGRAQAELAKTLERLGRPAGTTAASAAIWLRRTGGAPAEIESLERLSRRS